MSNCKSIFFLFCFVLILVFNKFWTDTAQPDIDLEVNKSENTIFYQSRLAVSTVEDESMVFIIALNHKIAGADLRFTILSDTYFDWYLCEMMIYGGLFYFIVLYRTTTATKQHTKTIRSLTLLVQNQTVTTPKPI